MKKKKSKTRMNDIGELGRRRVEENLQQAAQESLEKDMNQLPAKLESKQERDSRLATKKVKGQNKSNPKIIKKKFQQIYVKDPNVATISFKERESDRTLKERYQEGIDEVYDEESFDSESEEDELDLDDDDDYVGEFSDDEGSNQQADQTP